MVDFRDDELKKWLAEEYEKETEETGKQKKRQKLLIRNL